MKKESLKRKRVNEIARKNSQEEKISKFSNLKKLFLFRLSNKDQTFFIKRLSFLIKAGVPILDSLQMIREQTRKRSYGKILDKIIIDVSNGQRLSTSLGKYPNMFGDFSINIISYGESSGILSENLDYLADELRKKQVLKKKVIGAFISKCAASGYEALAVRAAF